MTEPESRGIAGSQFNIWRSLRGLPRDIWIISAASLINRAGTMGLPLLVLYLTRDQGFSAPRAGLALAVYGAGSIVAGPLAGRLSDRIGPLPVMQWSLVLTGVLLLVFPLASGFPAIIALTLLWAIVSEAFRPANLVMIAEIAAPEQRKPAFALSRLAINLGMSVGPAAAGFIAAKSFTLIFIVDAVTTLLAGMVLFVTPFTTRRDVSAPAARHGGLAQLRRLFVLDDRRFMLFLAALFLTGAVFFQHEGVLPLFLVENLGLSPAFYGLLFTVNTLMIVFIEVPLNAATAEWDHRRGLALGAFLFAAGSGVFAFASGPAMVIAGIVIWTFGEMLLFPQAAAYVTDAAPAHRRGEYMGAYALSFSLAFAVTPWAGTVVFSEFGAQVLWASVFFVGAISALMMMRVRSSTE
ncbi:MAG: MDR family MFS transporter [Gemmatimonadaceae bacterium]